MALVAHEPCGGLGGEERTSEVDIKGLTPHRSIDVVRPCRRNDARIVDQDIEPSEGLVRSLRELARIVNTTQITGQRDATKFPSYLVEAGATRPSVDGDPCAPLRECQGDCAAYAA